MKLDVLGRLEREAKQPAGIAPIIDAPELAQLLKERAGLKAALSDLYEHLMDECDITERGGPNQAMRAVNYFGPRVVVALNRCDE